MSDFDRAMSVLEKNKDKSFVKRILEPDKYPVLTEEDGKKATHKMEYSEVDGKHVVYPRVLLNERGDLFDAGDEAFSHARLTNNFITFDDEKEAAWFSKNYKAAWGGKPDNEP